MGNPDRYTAMGLTEARQLREQAQALRHSRIDALLREGLGVMAVAERLGISKESVRKRLNTLTGKTKKP